MWTRLIPDLRFALRSLARHPWAASVILLTLALGSGGTIAFFGIADAALLRPLPYPEPERLVVVSQSSDEFGVYDWPPPLLPDLRNAIDAFDVLVGFSPTWGMTLTEPSEPQGIRVSFVSDGVLDLFGMRPEAGRLFTAAEHTSGGPPAAVVTRAFWARHFGDAPLAQQTLTLDGSPYQVVGIVPADSRMPLTDSVVSQSGTSGEVWIPFVWNPYADLRTVPVMKVVGRLAPGASLVAARAEVARARDAIDAAYPEARLSDRQAVDPLVARVAAESRPVVLVLFGAAALLLLIGCANVANLLLSRAAARREELAIRNALGAGRGRLVGQLLTESAVLAVLGCLGGLALAAWLLGLLPALGLLQLPPSALVRLDLRVVGFAIGLSVGTTLLFGLAPALESTRRGGMAAPGDATRVAGQGAERMRSILVAGEVALAVVLLVGAGLLARSFFSLTAVDPGFRADSVLAAPIGLGQERWGAAPDRRVFFDELLDELGGTRGVTAAAAVNRLPLGGGNVFVETEFEAGNARGEEAIHFDRRVSTPGYLATVGIPLLAGRDFEPTDAADGEPVAIVNRTATELFTGDPIGQRVRLRLRSGPGPWMRIVGVVGDVQHHGLDTVAEPEIYVPYEQAPVQSMVVVARTVGDPAELIPAVQSSVWRRDDEIPLDNMSTLSALVDESVAAPRTRMLLMQAFAALALALAGVGIAGVVSYSVARRTRDFGIRLALGARPAEVLALALRDGLVPGAAGAALGVAAAVALSRLIGNLLFGISPADPITYTAVVALLLSIIALASWVPARRAASVDPVVILKEQ